LIIKEVRKSFQKLPIFNFSVRDEVRLGRQLPAKSGFTLIELLTVIAILSVIGGIAVSVIMITLRTTKKTDLLETARENGGSALTQMVKSIRFAQSLDTPATCVPSQTVNAITITSLSDHAQTTYSCAGGTIASNGASLIDTTSLQATACSFVCAQATTNDPPTITIQFTLSPQQSNGFEENNFTLPFQTSVTVRNYQQ
jgi:prepilin-type N-terminal cleavage/methylation domain-containing protein